MHLTINWKLPIFVIVMDTNDIIHRLCLKLDQIESSGEWLTRTNVHESNSSCQTATLIQVLAEEVREELIKLVVQLEEEAENVRSMVTKH